MKVYENSYYTLIWKFNGMVNFNSFVSFEGLKEYIKENIKNGEIKNLKPVDDEKTIWYLDIKDSEVNE